MAPVERTCALLFPSVTHSLTHTTHRVLLDVTTIKLIWPVT